jgi:hypothetical protein
VCGHLHLPCGWPGMRSRPPLHLTRAASSPLLCGQGYTRCWECRPSTPLPTIRRAMPWLRDAMAS